MRELRSYEVIDDLMIRTPVNVIGVQRAPVKQTWEPSRSLPSFLHRLPNFPPGNQLNVIILK